MKQLSLLIKPASSACNLRCKYCFYADVAGNRNTPNYGTISNGTLENLVKKAFAYSDSFISFAFQGGEPTVAGQGFYENFARLQKKYNTKKIRVSNTIQTNGTLIDESFAKFLSKNKYLVGLSLDGTENVHNINRIDAKGKGTFHSVIKCTELFDIHGVDYNILTVINTDNFRYVKEIYNFYKYRNFRFLQFIPCIDDFNMKSKFKLNNRQYQLFLKNLFDLWFDDLIRGNYISIRNFDNYINILKGLAPENCAMGGICGRYYTVEGDGTLFPCDFYCVDKWKLGNINETDFFDLENNDITENFINDSKLLGDKCKKCSYYYICRGGCKREREPDYNINKYCDAYFGFFSYAIGRMRYIAKNCK